jgi:hypothetical protein
MQVKCNTLYYQIYFYFFSKFFGTPDLLHKFSGTAAGARDPDILFWHLPGNSWDYDHTAAGGNTFASRLSSRHAAETLQLVLTKKKPRIKMQGELKVMSVLLQLTFFSLVSARQVNLLQL